MNAFGDILYMGSHACFEGNNVTFLIEDIFPTEKKE